MERARIDAHEHFASFDRAAFAEGDSDDPSRNLRADRGHLPGRDRAEPLARDVDGLRLDLDGMHRNRRRRRLRRGGRALAFALMIKGESHRRHAGRKHNAGEPKHRSGATLPALSFFHRH